MPPWKPDLIVGAELLGARRLADRDIATIEKWVAGGAREGAPGDLPPLPSFPDGWRLGQPDLIVTMPEPYVLEPGGGDQLRNFVIPLPLTQARYVRGFEFRPDNPRVVHHANIRVDVTGSARTSDAADPAPGFDGRLSGGAEFPDGQFLGWTPGQLPPLLDGDSAWRLEPKSDLVVQLHMRPTDRRERVQVRVGFFFTDSPPQHTPVMIRLGKEDLDLAPGVTDYRVDDSYRLPVNARVLAIQPHAHYRAREVSASAALPDGSIRQMLHITNWDFDWQDQYRYVTPVALPAGTTLRMSYRYDNSRSNPRNPDYPPRRVRWGQNSSDEMGDVWFQVIADDDTSRARLVADVGRKVLAEDTTGFETLLEGDPRNARLHEAAAALLLSLGEVDRAAAHLASALEIEPHSVEAHYNLATALVWQGRTDEAMSHLETVLATTPQHVGANVNLGAILKARGDLAGAATHLQRAIEIDPGNAAAHTNLGGVFMLQGHVSRAVAEYRAALSTNRTAMEALTELAWTLATSPSTSIRNAAEAVTLGERARAVSGERDVRTLDALAAAYAAAGRFTDATRVLDTALQLMAGDASGAAESRRLLQDRRARYARGQAYVDPGRGER